MAAAGRAGLVITTPSEREIVMIRAFDAPRRLVWDAFTRPELLKRWYGPPGWSLVVCEVDLRVGGAWRYLSRGPDGSEMGMRGVYREVVPPERLVTTQSFDESDHPGESRVTTVFVERAGRTTVTTTVLYPTREARDAVIRTNMERGAAASYDRLAEYLETLGGWVTGHQIPFP